MEKVLSKQDILHAALRIEPHIHHTPLLTSEAINSMFNASFFFKCENFQKVGAFKSRGAVNAVFSLPEGKVKNGVSTHSSGNHAQALARAAKLRNIPAYIVMPDNAPQVKIDAVRSYGGIITFCKPTLEAREQTLEMVVKDTAAVEIHPYNNYTIIEGQATCGKELIEDAPHLDMILCPVGGGGLLSGTALAAHYFSDNTSVIACEPDGADDAFRSFKAGIIIPSTNPNTIADGLLTSLGEKNFPIIQKYVDDIVTVSEKAIVDAMKLVYERMKVVIEPSSAVPLAAVIENKIDVTGRTVGVVFSGGNVDLSQLPF